MATVTTPKTVSGSCLKSELYGVIKSAMLAAGWVNASTNPTSDFDVMTSTGKSGNLALVIQMRPTNTTATNSVVDTAYNVMSYRLIGNYVPGAAQGVAGTTVRSALAWSPLHLVPVAATTTTPADITVQYKILADKNKVITGVEYPAPLALAPNVIYMGQPDTQFTTEIGSRGVIVATTNNAAYANAVQITDNAKGLTSLTAPDTRTCYANLAAKNPNSENILSVSDVVYGNSTEGTRGKLDDIIVMPNQAVQTGYIVQLPTGAISDMTNYDEYYVYVCQALSNCAFPTVVVGIKTAEIRTTA